MTGSKSSGLLSADAAVLATPGTLIAATLICDGTNDATLIIYDNASAASGTALIKLAASPECQTAHVFFGPEGQPAANGLYADVGGTGAGFMVHYRPRVTA